MTLLARWAVLLVAACTAHTTAPPKRVPDAVYALQTIAGDTLPWTFPAQAGSAPTTVTAGGVLLGGDSTYTDWAAYSVALPDGTTYPIGDTLRGTYWTRGDSLVFRIAVYGWVYMGWTDGQTLRIVWAGAPWQYTRVAR